MRVEEGSCNEEGETVQCWRWGRRSVYRGSGGGVGGGSEEEGGVVVGGGGTKVAELEARRAGGMESKADKLSPAAVLQFRSRC